MITILTQKASSEIEIETSNHNDGSSTGDNKRNCDKWVWLWKSAVWSQLWQHTPITPELHVPIPYCWSDALPAHIDSHDNRQIMMSVKHGCMCSIFTASLQMPEWHEHWTRFLFLFLFGTQPDLHHKAHTEHDAKPPTLLMRCCALPWCIAAAHQH